MTIPDPRKPASAVPGAVLQQADPEVLRSVFQLLRLLLGGEPVSADRFAVVAGLSRMEAEAAFTRLRAWGAEFDGAGDFVGAGVTLVPTQHHYGVDGRQFYTWCAADTLLFPLMLGHTAVIESSDPVSGERVWATVSPDGIEQIEPDTTVLTSRRGGDAENVRGSMCQYGHYFASPNTASEYVAHHGGVPLEILTPDEAFRLSRALTEQGSLRASRRTG